jgi:GrpB-like predicted nucleotidyltransferase (UPF0157 family)
LAEAAVELVPNDPAWPELFEAERRRLAGMLPGADVEHYGATAVPGLAARPVIDVIALVGDLDGPIAVLVERGGYSYPAGAGASRRRELLRDGFRLTLTDDRSLLEHGLRFREALRADDALAREYEELRRSLGGDAEAYAAAKAEFVARATASEGA